MRIVATLSWDEELTEEDIGDFLNAIKYVRLLSTDRQMRMNRQTHDIVRKMIHTADSGVIDTASKDGVINRLNGIKVHIDNRRPDNEIRIY